MSSSIGAFLFCLLSVYMYKARQYYFQRHADNKAYMRLTVNNPTTITIFNNVDIDEMEVEEEPQPPSPVFSSDEDSGSSNENINCNADSFRGSSNSCRRHSAAEQPDLLNRRGAELCSVSDQSESKSSEGSAPNIGHNFQDNTIQQETVSSEWQSQCPMQQKQYHHSSSHNNNNNNNNNNTNTDSNINQYNYLDDSGESIDSDFSIDLESSEGDNSSSSAVVLTDTNHNRTDVNNFDVV